MPEDERIPMPLSIRQIRDISNHLAEAGINSDFDSIIVDVRLNERERLLVLNAFQAFADNARRLLDIHRR
jgi:hypothetical protein